MTKITYKSEIEKAKHTTEAPKYNKLSFAIK